MPCYQPLQAYSAPGGISFNRSDSFGIPIELPCGRCIGCRLEKSKEWAIRCVHESQMHEDNVFITLTYATQHLPKNSSLDKTHFQKFIRALRQKTKQKIRYYMAGEYGNEDETHRPHFHAILFGYKFPDAYLSNIRDNNRVYRSPLLESIWTFGTSEIGSVTFKSAAYVARYILKKQNSAQATQDRYCIYDKQTGEVTLRQFEYTHMSMKPGIGETWYRKFKNDIFPDDFVITPDGRQMQTPGYYRILLQREDPKLYEQLRTLRIEKSRNSPDNTPDRLATREICKQKQADRLTRQL